MADTAVNGSSGPATGGGGRGVGVLGLTFKENRPNAQHKVVDIVRELADYQVRVLVHDPLASAEEAHREYGLTLEPLEAFRNLDALILAVPHASYLKTLEAPELRSWFRDEGQGIVLDVRGALDRAALRDRRAVAMEAVAGHGARSGLRQRPWSCARPCRASRRPAGGIS